MNMQNGTFPWVSPPSLASQKGPWPGYQASLTDLFLKKNSLHQFGTGISQLAAASSYLEKMSTLGTSSSVPGSSANSELVLNHAAQHQIHNNSLKCPHPDSKDKQYPCDICIQQYSNFCASGPVKTSDITTTCSSRMASSDSILDHKTHIHGASSHLPHSHLPPSSGLPLLSHQPPSHPRRSSSNGSGSGSSAGTRHRNPSNKQFLCPVCHRCFTQKGNLKTHMMIHTGEKPYSCQICGKSFTQKGNVDTHMKIHTGEKDYGCDSCGKRFTQKGNLKTHVRSVHTKEKPFVCGMCGKSFSQKGNMQTHIRTHNKDDRFPCNLCGKTFSQKGNLKTHMQRHTGQLPARRYGSKRHSGANRHSQVHSSSSGAFTIPTSTITENSARDSRHQHLKSANDDSASPVEHSILNSSGHHHTSANQMTSPASASLTSPETALSPSHTPLKLSHHSSSRETAAAIEALHSPPSQSVGQQNQNPTQQQTQQQQSQSQSQAHQHLQSHRSPAASPIAMTFPPCSTASRAFYSAPTTPLAAHASWLSAAATASQNLVSSNKNRPIAAHYDNFNLSSYGGFHGQHAGMSLSRLSLLASPPAHSVSSSVGVSESEQKHSSSQSQTRSETSSTSSQQHSQSQQQQSQQPQQQQGNQSSSTHHQFPQSTPNPDFSQLLD